MKSEEYWKQRAEARMTRGQVAAGETLKGLQEAYAKASKEIQGEIRRLYERYGDEHGLTYAEAIKYIDQSEYKDWRMSLADYVKRINATGDEELQRELDTLSTRSRVTRLETVQTAVKVNASELAQKGEDAVTQLLGDTYTDTYYRAAYDMQMGVGVGSTLEMLAPGTVAKAISYPWSGADYSKRIWDNADRMTAALQSTITQGLIQGKDVRQMTKAIVDATGASVLNAERLVRTETAAVVEAAELKNYADSGVTQYEVLATLDERTCKVCGAQDGKVYDADKAVTSKTYPPWHSNCRCTTVAHFSAEQMDEWERLGAEALGEPVQHDAEERFARDAEGKGTAVPGDLKYADWFDQYVKADKAYANKYKAYHNRSADLRQLKRYSDALGKKAVTQSLEKFQAMKYGGGDDWKELKARYAKNLDKSGISEYNKSSGGEVTRARILTETGEEKYRYLQTDAIQKLQSSGDIVNYFKYVDRWGDEESPIDTSVSKLKLETQKELAEGMAYAKEQYHLEKFPVSIGIDKLPSSEYGQFRVRNGVRSIAFSSNLDGKLSEAFQTAVHEMTHYVDDQNKNFSTDIHKEALKNLGLRANSKEAYNLAYGITGNDKSARDPAEILAYSAEKYAVNKGNKLSDEIVKILNERLKK